MKIEDYEVLIFDCDGVILDTNKLKVSAFKKVLDEFGISHVQKFLDYFKRNFGRSRYIHVKYFIEDILKITFDEDLYNRILIDYGHQCQLLYKSAQICEGVISLLEQTKNITKYVASGSDQSELRDVFKLRGIDHYFESIYGSPKLKNDLVEDIHRVNQDKSILLIGDSEADYIAAASSSIDFLFVSRYSMDNENMSNLSNVKKFKTVYDLSEIS